jgi:hypothetical protein
LLWYRDVYSGIAAGGGKATGLSLGRAKALTGSGFKRWSTGELSIVDRPCLPLRLCMPSLLCRPSIDPLG